MKFILRHWMISDLEGLIVHANNIRIASMLTDKFPHPYTEASGRWFIEFANSHTPQQIFAIDVEEQAIGTIGIYPQEDIFCKNVELGYWLAEPFWGKGIMTEAIKRITAYTFQTFEINRIFARPFGSNVGSQKVLEKAGYSLEAKFEATLFKLGKYEDEHVYGLRRHDYMALNS